MIDGDAVQPRAKGRLAAELIQLAEGLQENVMRGVLGLLRVAQETQRQIINRAAVFGIETGKFRGRQVGWRLCHELTSCGRLVHECLHR
jgi:hypothetical protein